MKITLLRHAAIDPDFERCYNGHNDIGLSNPGKIKAKALNESLKTDNFDAIYCSDLRRAKETLELFCQRDDIIYTKELREKSWGRHEGLNFESIVTMEGKHYENFEQWLEVLDGEEYPLFIQRVRSFFFDFLPKQSHNEILIVTHSGVIRTLFHLLEGLSLEAAFSKKVDYASTITLDFDTSLGEMFSCASSF